MVGSDIVPVWPLTPLSLTPLSYSAHNCLQCGSTVTSHNNPGVSRVSAGPAGLGEAQRLPAVEEQCGADAT